MSARIVSDGKGNSHVYHLLSRCGAKSSTCINSFKPHNDPEREVLSLSVLD